MKKITLPACFLAVVLFGCGDNAQNGGNNGYAGNGYAGNGYTGNGYGNEWICKMDLFVDNVDPNNVCACNYTTPDPSYNRISECSKALFNNAADCILWENGSEPPECFCRRYMCGQFGDGCVCGGYPKIPVMSCTGALCCANLDSGTCFCDRPDTLSCDADSVQVVSCDADYVLPQLLPTTLPDGVRVEACPTEIDI